MSRGELGPNAAPRCPHCGELTDAFVDEGGAQYQEYIEDCCVCCRPIRFVLRMDEDGEWLINADADI